MKIESHQLDIGFESYDQNTEECQTEKL